MSITDQKSRGTSRKPEQNRIRDHSRILAYMLAAPLLFAIVIVAGISALAMALNQPKLPTEEIILCVLVSWVVAQWFSLLMMYRAYKSGGAETRSPA
jgi:hypothetical protein